MTSNLTVKENNMPNYKTYCVEGKTRKQRKSSRKATFEFNKQIASVERKARRLARKEIK